MSWVEDSSSAGYVSAYSGDNFDLATEAKSYGRLALFAIAEIAQDKNIPAKTRLIACKELLDRGYGKTAQIRDASGEEASEYMRMIRKVNSERLNLEGTVVSTIVDSEEVF